MAPNDPANEAAPESPVVAAATAATNQRVLDRALISGLGWTGSAKGLTQLVSWGTTLVVARFLAPSDYGIIGMAQAYIGFVQLFNELGLGAAMVQQRHLGHDDLARLGGLSALVGTLALALSLALSGVVALAYGEPRVGPVVAVLSVTFLLSALQVLPNALLGRDLDFKRLAQVDAAEALTQAAVTLTLALAGFAYWALAAGIIAGRASSLVMSVWYRRHPLRWPRQLRQLAQTLTLSGHLVGGRVAWYVYNNSSIAIVGRVLGSSAAGAYSFGWQIASIPVDKIAAILSRVAVPVFSAVQHDRVAMGRYLRGLTEGIVLLTFPITLGLALVADHFVLVVLGPQWEAAIVPLRLLALFTAVKSITVLFSNVLVAVGQARRAMLSSVAAACVLPVLFLVGTRWGNAGVAAAWFVGFLAVILPLTFPITLRSVQMPVTSFLGALWPASAASGVMVAAVAAVRTLMPESWSLSLQLAVEVGTGALAVGATIGLGLRSRVRRYRDLFAGRV